MYNFSCSDLLLSYLFLMLFIPQRMFSVVNRNDIAKHERDCSFLLEKSG